MRTLTALSTSVLLVLARPGIAQGPPGTNITVAVGVTAVAMRGDTADVTYSLGNQATSIEQLFQFTVDAPAHVFRLSLPQPQGDWVTGVAYRGRSVARWTVLGDQLAPGEGAPPLVLTAIGLPTLVTYWVRGYTPPSTDIPSDTVPVSDPLTANSVADTTVGVEPFPTDRSAGGLLVRLHGLVDQTCGTALAWITSSTVCSSLGGKLDTASQRLSQADTTGAQTQIQSFLTELGAQHGTGLPVNDSAYWLLKVNAEYILTKL